MQRFRDILSIPATAVGERPVITAIVQYKLPPVSTLPHAPRMSAASLRASATYRD
jgi:hypothetical protein